MRGWRGEGWEGQLRTAGNGLKSYSYENAKNCENKIVLKKVQFGFSLS